MLLALTAAIIDTYPACEGSASLGNVLQTRVNQQFELLKIKYQKNSN